MQRIAILGLGNMGAGMAANWLAKGFPLTVYNRTRSKAEPFAAQGARVASTPAEAVRDAELILAMVTDDDASRELWLGTNGIMAGAKLGALLVESSTISPDWSRELAAEVKARGFEFLEAPVTGSKGAAADGKLVMYVGGSPSTLDKARPALEAISGQIYHMGEVGMAATWKLVNNMIIATHIAVVSEGLTLARKAGLDMQQVTTLIASGAGASPIVKMKLPRLTEHNHDNNDFSLSNMFKDTRYAVALAQQYDVPLEVVEAVSAVYARAEAQGLGGLDMSAVIESIATPQ
jgi:3-hydroxyisobutyrate dehydrogenase